MNTREPRWRVTAPIRDEDAWELMLAEVSDTVEGVVELADSAELYFVRAEDAEECSRRFGLAPPEASVPGGGEVFGQLSHPTTEMCLELVRKFMRPGDVVADVGSGTGRLVAEAMQLGARLAVGLDIDWPAAQASHAATGSAVQGSADALAAGQFDGVAANLHLAAWREVADQVSRIAAGEAWLVASGFLEEQEDVALSMLAAHRWRVVEIMRRDGWLALAAIRSGAVSQ